jgi:hypothetical protein
MACAPQYERLTPDVRGASPAPFAALSPSSDDLDAPCQEDHERAESYALKSKFHGGTPHTQHQHHVIDSEKRPSRVYERSEESSLELSQSDRTTSRRSYRLADRWSGAKPSAMIDRIRIIKYEAVSLCGSFEVRFPDDRPSRFYYWDDIPGRRLRPDLVDCTAALQAARTVGAG